METKKRKGRPPKKDITPETKSPVKVKRKRGRPKKVKEDSSHNSIKNSIERVSKIKSKKIKYKFSKNTSYGQNWVYDLNKVIFKNIDGYIIKICAFSETITSAFSINRYLFKHDDIKLYVASVDDKTAEHLHVTVIPKLE